MIKYSFLLRPLRNVAITVWRPDSAGTRLRGKMGPQTFWSLTLGGGRGDCPVRPWLDQSLDRVIRGYTDVMKAAKYNFE